MQISRSKPDSLHRTPAGFTALALDGYGLCDILPARPTNAASYPVSVRRVATLLHASFRQSLAVLPLRFARLHLHQVVRGLSPPKLSNMLDTQGCATRPGKPASALEGDAVAKQVAVIPLWRNGHRQQNSD